MNTLSTVRGTSCGLASRVSSLRVRIGLGRWRHGAALLLALALICCTSDSWAQKLGKKPVNGGRTVIRPIPWDPSTLTEDKIIYGTDDRLDVYEETNPDRVAMAAATCGLMFSSQLSDNGNGTFTINTSAYTRSGLPACPSEPYGAQPTAAFCTGFLVGDDLIATAGHCFDTSDLVGTRFVFGFDMLDAVTPVTVVDADQVYTAVEVIGRQYTVSAADYTVVRVDRIVTAPGAVPLEIRRTGTVANGIQIGLIGHPSGLPKKISFGAQTVVLDNSPATFFVSNVDAYGGNSGSPVFNATTGVVEGILVRGAGDFEIAGNCFVSAQLADSQGAESSTKTTVFAGLIPPLASSAGTVTFTDGAYGCADTITVRVADTDLSGSVNITISASGGDSETVVLSEVGNSRFEGTIGTDTAGVTTENGTLNVLEGEIITATYNDADSGGGGAAVVTDNAEVDCTAPVLSNIVLASVGGRTAEVSFTTDEDATPRVRYGTACGALSQTASSGPGTAHSVVLTNLVPLTTYYFSVEGVDAAGNISLDDNGGACFTFSTLDQSLYFTEDFLLDFPDLANKTLRFTPDGSSSFYAGCVEEAPAFPTNPTGGTPVNLTDDDSQLVSLTGGAQVSLYGQSYSGFYIGSNGYITFTGPDDEFFDSPLAHFDRPRISALFLDLNPADGGTITWRQFSDRAVVTYQGLPEFLFGGSNNLQVEMFFDGTITITHGAIDGLFGIVGLSEGLGVPADYVSQDLSASPVCGEIVFDPAGFDFEDPYGTSPPRSIIVVEGNSARLRVPANNGPYQWYREDVALSDGTAGSGAIVVGATTATLIIENIQLSDTGGYYAIFGAGEQTPTTFVGVVPAGAPLPSAGLLGLALLAGACAVAGRRAVLHTRRP